MIDGMRKLEVKTRTTYIGAVRKLAAFMGRSPTPPLKRNFGLLGFAGARRRKME